MNRVSQILLTSDRQRPLSTAILHYELVQVISYDQEECMEFSIHEHEARLKGDMCIIHSSRPVSRAICV